MPKLPITTRTILFQRLASGSLIRLPWNLVNTSLGAMVEPVSVAWLDPDQKAGLTDVDLEDQAFTEQAFVDPASMYQLVGTWGAGIPYGLLNADANP